LVAVIKALDKASKKHTLSRDEAARVWKLAELRRDYGDYPEATLRQLNGLDTDDPWAADAIAALKKERPTNTDAADAIETRCHLAYVTHIYAEHGTLPDNLPVDWGTLQCLEDMPSEKRTAFLEKLNAAESLDEDIVTDIAGDVRYAGEPEEVDQEPEEVDEEPASAGGPLKYPRVVAAVMKMHGKSDEEIFERTGIRPDADDDAEASSPSDDLAEKLRAAEIKIVGLESEIEDLKAENGRIDMQLQEMLDRGMICPSQLENEERRYGDLVVELKNKVEDLKRENAVLRRKLEMEPRRADRRKHKVE